MKGRGAKEGSRGDRGAGEADKRCHISFSSLEFSRFFHSWQIKVSFQILRS